MDDAERIEGDAIVAGNGDERIAIGLCLNGIVADGIASVLRALSPLFTASHDEGRASDGCRP